MLDWFRDPSLRRRAQAGLKKGEARNALGRAVFMHQLGEIGDRGWNQTVFGPFCRTEGWRNPRMPRAGINGFRPEGAF